MKKIWLAAITIIPAVFGQQAQTSKPAEPPLHPSFALEDPTILQGRVAKRPEIGKSGPVPRLAGGKPDLTGPWEPNAIAANVNLKATGVDIPFTPEGEKIYKERLARLGKDDPEARCLPPGVPRLTTTPYPFRFVQAPNYIAILYEGGTHTWRQIFMDGRKFSQFADDLWNGESIGHWEGDTLVVETTGFNDRTWIDAAGLPHSTNLKVTERITRLDAENMEIVSTIDDPEMYSRKWSFTTYPKKLKGELLEYICNENEKDVQHFPGK